VSEYANINAQLYVAPMLENKENEHLVVREFHTR